MEFFLPMIPPTVTQQTHRVAVNHGKPIFYDSPELADAKAKLIAYLSKHKPDVPFTGAVRLIVKWCFPVTGKHHNGEYKTTEPDTDNLQKALKDCMTSCGFWRDDALVASEIIEKFWSDVPGIFISVERI